MIPKEKIEEVKDRASIVGVISEYVPLAKRGANHLGLCPFHSEKTPSFTVSEEKKIYYCFGCNATGNVITFIMKKEGLEFPEAVRSLAKRCGVVITEESVSGKDPREVLYGALRASAEYFTTALNGPEGKGAREYLGKRGYEGQILKDFSVGFAPDRWEGLAGFLKRKGVGHQDAERAGLLIKKERGYYDRFRGRVIFPITDVRGRVVGFGGRAMGEAMPKYLNSPESPVFKKGETLYGLFQAKQSITKEGFAVVVEGYFDLMAMHKYGFTNSVATMGTALTSSHIRTLKGYSASIYSLFDSDEAGRNAAIRGLNLFLSEDAPCRAVLLSSGKDPDEFLASSGREAMKEAIDKAEPLMEFYLNELKKKTDTSKPEGKRRYLEAARQYIMKVQNVAERGHYAQIAASTLGINVGLIFDDLKKAAPGANGAAPLPARGAVEPAGSRLKELTILRVLLRHPELISAEVVSGINAFRDPVLRQAAQAVASLCREGKALDPAAVCDGVPDGPARAALASMLVKGEEGFIESPERMLQDSLKSILNKGKMKQTTREMISRLEEKGLEKLAVDMKKRVGAASAKK